NIINGGFRIWQRGTSWSGLIASGFTADRHKLYISGTFNASASQQSFAVGQSEVPGYPIYYLRITGNSGSGTCGWEYKIEDVRTLAEKSVTFSMYVKGTAGGTFTLSMYQDFGSGGSAAVTVATTTSTISSNWVRLVLTAVLPSLSGKSIGDDSCVQFRFEQAGWTGNLDIAHTQLEVGDVATEFAAGPVDMELARCRRYFFKYFGNLWGYVRATGPGNPDWVLRSCLSITMRVRSPAVYLPSSISSWVLESAGEASGYTIRWIAHDYTDLTITLDGGLEGRTRGMGAWLGVTEDQPLLIDAEL
ncbi:MAG: hypothetical protein HQL62_09990, partial [Magnetococcales bacterium]|nr:hypothetical protein [Magnetococcales bacterium]